MPPNQETSRAPNSPSVAPSSTQASARQDVLSLKHQLAEALGDNGQYYWQALTDFVRGRLNRQEFDFYANLYLNHENAHLHNKFILANLHNAQLDIPPPTQRSVGWSKRKRAGTSEADGDPKRRRLKEAIISLGKAERERLKALKREPGKRGRPPMLVKGVVKPAPTRFSAVAKTPMYTGTREKLPSNYQQEYVRGVFAPLCADAKALPDFESFRDRMAGIALEHGLFGGVTEDSVHLMRHALESHLKTLVSNCISKIRANRGIGIQLPAKQPAPSTAVNPATATAIPLSASSSSSSSSSSSFSSPSPSSAAPTGPATTPTPSQPHPQPSQPSPSADTSPVTPPSTTSKMTITAQDLAFGFAVTPHVTVQTPMATDRLLTLLEEDDDEADGEDGSMEDDKGKIDEGYEEDDEEETWDFFS
ncbi:uncharacterized protein VTP21DRAFT_2190 [Calcarisporiella thermophila]|uniref:uncharacterized protein n=1 Tax=Calcarisporiella thermophila TaxID=911321 RepID=UPI0037420F63